MAALIGALRVSLSADTAKFETGMKRAQASAARASTGINKSLGLLKTGIAGLAAGLSIGLLARAISSALEYAGSLAEVAQQLGVTTRDLQVFRFAAGQVGVKQEQLETGLSKLTITLGKVAAGAKAPAAALRAIGISADQLKGKDTGEAFRIIADGLEKVTDRSQRAAVEVALFGKTGAMLDNLLSGGSSAINQLSAAAEKLGIVLSDEQIRRADETADKLDALKTVLSARIAGIVADNAQSILGLVSALGDLVGAIGGALAAWSNFRASVRAGLLERVGNEAEAARLRGSVFQSDKTESIPGRSVTISLPPAKARKRPAGPDIGRFLAGGGSNKHAREDHSAQDALRDQFQFDQRLRSAQMDVLRAQQQLATDYTERTSIGIDILNAEKDAFEAELRYQTALFALTKGKEGLSEVQAAQLQLEFDHKDALERQSILDDEEQQRQQDFNDLQQHDFERQTELLQNRAAIAETASERRKIELQLLQIAFEQRKQALQNVIDTSKDFREIEDARRDLANLPANFALAKTNILQQTRGPMEDWLASLPTTAAKAQEALEALQVQGFEGLIDSVLALSQGVGAATDSLLETLKQFLLGLARMELQRSLGNFLQGSGGVSGIFSSIFGGGGGSAISQKLGDALGGFATGGFTGWGSPNRIAGVVHGREGVLNTQAMRRLGVPTLNALNRGVPLSAVTSNDNGWHGGRSPVVMNVYTPDADSFRRSEGQTTRSLKRKLA